MSYVVINAITVPTEMREAFEARFAARAGEVSKSPGFKSFRLLRPDNEGAGDRYFVYTEWQDKASFESWMGSAAFTKGHSRPAEGGPVGTGSEVLLYDVIQEEDV